MERLRCARCGNVLSAPVRNVEMPAPPHPSTLQHHRLNPPLLEPGTYTIDEAEHGKDRVVGTIVLSPGDVRGTEFVHDRVDVGCWSLVGRRPCMACTCCGALAAGRTDDCGSAQETRFHPDAVVWEDCGEDPPEAPHPFPLNADWDEASARSAQAGSIHESTRPRPGLVATRWRTRGLKPELYRDDPPA